MYTIRRTVSYCILPVHIVLAPVLYLEMGDFYRCLFLPDLRVFMGIFKIVKNAIEFPIQSGFSCLKIFYAVYCPYTYLEVFLFWKKM